jgi:hypothetical protein
MGSGMEIVEVDLRDAELEDLLVFVFSHRPTGKARGSKEWFWKKDYRLKVDPTRQVVLMTQLFRRSAKLLQTYSQTQIEDGFWFIIGPAGSDWFRDQLWNRRVAWHARSKCIASIPHLYTGVFRAPLGAMSHMLWDLLTEDYRFGNRDPKRNRDARRVQLAMLRALEVQLALPHREAQTAALHGLGHIGMPEARTCIRKFLRRKRLPRSLVSYAEQALTGNLL